MEKVRIQKALSDWGVASRRAVEEMVVEGRITVNGKVVNELPFFIDPEKDEVFMDGQSVQRRAPQRAYFLLNKPRGTACTASDAQGRPLAISMVPEMKDRIYCVGGLDVDSSGLVMFTNDGELTKRMTDRRSGLEMTYVLEVDGRPDESSLMAVTNGVFIDGQRTAHAKVTVLQSNPTRSQLELVIAEGRNRIIRRLFHHLSHKIRRLHREAIGPISEGGLKIEHFRALSPREVQQLRAASEPKEISLAGRGRRRERRQIRKPTGD